MASLGQFRVFFNFSRLQIGSASLYSLQWKTIESMQFGSLLDLHRSKTDSVISKKPEPGLKKLINNS